MKKTLLTCCVFMTVVCCALAFTSTGESPLTLFKTMSVNTKQYSEAKSEMDRNTTSPDFNMEINKESINTALSRVPSSENKSLKKARSASEGNYQDIVVDLWNNAAQIYPFKESASFDDASNKITFPGTQEYTSQIVSGLNNSGDYAWHAEEGQIYQFSGTLTANGEATVSPCIVYSTGSNTYIASNETISLSKTNGYTCNFNISASGIKEGYAIYVAYLIENTSPETTITSENNQFYYSYRTLIAQQWSSDKDLPGLGLKGFSSDTYTIKCEDGVTTLGLYYDGSVFVTGINTTATEVTLPKYVTIGENTTKIDYFGSYSYYYNTMDWSGAPNLTTLDVSAAKGLQVESYGSTLTDLYIGKNTTFSSYPSGISNIYLHIPYSASRSDYNYYGFKRILVGEEQSYYPEPSSSNWVIAGENEGEYFGISQYNGYYCISEIFTNSESVVLPETTPTDNGRYYIRYFGNNNNYLCSNALTLKSVTIPQTYSNIYVRWSYFPIIELHMQGDVIDTYYSLNSDMTVYVSDKNYYSNYANTSNWKNATIAPEGWEFEWLTVNVARKGEFAQTYIEMTDANWSIANYVKITGTLNTTDLQNIKNFTNLLKLDLSEALFTSLPSSFLQNNSKLIEAILPDYISQIPASAFNYCTSLSKVSAPGLTSIGNYAFDCCSKLTDLDISKVQTIGQCAFRNCTLYNPTDISATKSIDSYAFESTAIEKVVIPEGLTTINQNTFYNCTKLADLTFSQTITTIGQNAFNNCTALKAININEGLTTINTNAFYNCSHLEEITLPSTLQSLSSGILSGCSSLTTVKCKAIVPPSSSGSFTSGIDLNHCTLYIAPFTIDAYRAATNWSNFYIMKPLNEPIKEIYINRLITFDLLSEDNAVLQDNPNIELDYYDNYNSSVGQLTATGDGTLSAGIFTIYHSFGPRQSPSTTDYRTTLVNNAENMRADSVLCSINFEKNRWHFISFPYDVQMSDVFGLNNTDYVIRQYNSANRAMGNATGNWETVPSDGILEAGKGYIIQAANNTTNEKGNSRLAVVKFPSQNTLNKNNLFTSNNVIVPLEEYPAEFDHNRSWNLVGNPYPCYYDMHYLMDEFTTPIVLWRGTSYQAYSPIDDDIILRPNEAFFVQRPLNAEQMVFGAEGRMHYSAAYSASSGSNTSPGIYYAPAENTTTALRNVFNFHIEGCGSDDRTRIVINENASMDYDIDRDASKFFAETCLGAEIYVDGDIKYDICERPLETGIASLGTRLAKDGIYTISLSGLNMNGWSVILTDTGSNTNIDLTKDSYEFDGQAGTYSNRFIITFKAPIGTSVDELSESEVTGYVRIVDMSGIVIFEGELDTFMQNASAGVYVAVSGNGTSKIIVK